jgi:hypothetical protein
MTKPREIGEIADVRSHDAAQHDVAENYPRQSEQSTGESAGYTNQTLRFTALLGTWRSPLGRPTSTDPGDVPLGRTAGRGR